MNLLTPYRSALSFVLCFILQTSLKAESAPASSGFSLSHGPFVQTPSETEVTISWATSGKSISRVAYRPENSEVWITNTPARHGLVEADTRYHNVTLTGLVPGQRYLYRAISQEITDFQPYRVRFGDTVTSPEYHFTALDRKKPEFSFVVVNDRHERAAQLAASFNTVNWTGVDLTFLNGDMVNAVKDEEQLMRCIVDPAVKSFAGSIPLVYVRGNHDTRGSFARQLMDYFPTPSGRYYYTINHGPVCFLILDCGEDKSDLSEEYSGLVAFDTYMDQQVRWLAETIKTPEFRKAHFRICLLHIPPAPSADQKFIRPKWLYDNVAPLLNRGRVDLLICGHTHDYEVQPKGTHGMNFPIVIGGTETVIRGDVSGKTLKISTTDLSGTTLKQLPPIEVR